jgi:beta-xylosidase
MHNRTPVAEGSKPLKDFAIHICKVDLTNGRCLSRPQMARSSASGVAEGSHIIKREKYYYLFTAEGGTEGGHSEFVSRSEFGPLGPWELGGKVISSGTGPEDEVQNTGHCDLVEDAGGHWWAVLLAVRPTKKLDGAWEKSVFGMCSNLTSKVWLMPRRP